ncbi:hypothetical protein H7J07_11940 [Mycobacterium koreense]|uniref:Uncharacterized protein n=1 Tax=Mycolicibacillus koreensis TaxID=1069220 RepID=A0A7I7SBJ7_9MYCO|nr:hypothetical protein [Mycolicibacillus koreensis]MCV7248924.1 hypothetical protein [Mycolicibacillus koreensis]OSC36110.1 hypothetical protein B8W67_00275 [Mycolicibacillus koreensis]BBY53771.1 hypothetical protein MKOR_10220 [Mycolicibacillus koreensis]
MCQPVRCRQCGKTTWSGCGQHVDQVRATVKPDQWCAGHPQPPATPMMAGLRRRWRRRGGA